MPRVHFLNVRNGDCSIITHGSGRVSVIDVSCAFNPMQKKALHFSRVANLSEDWKPVPGNYDQKAHPDNPIEYLHKIGVSSIFRFILTHPDMDHLDGFYDLFVEFRPANFWDTANTKEFEENAFEGRPNLERDWGTYKYLRDNSPSTDPKRLVYHSGDSNEFYNKDGLSILAPTPQLVEAGNKRRNWNDASYVILYKSCGRKILFSGDSEDKTWEHILANWKAEVSNLDILLAPHHGRDSGRSYDFLDVTKPKLTLFGNASSEHLAYSPWYNRGLPILTNNQGGYIILDIDSTDLTVYCKHETYARNFCKENGYETRKNEELGAWFLGTLK